MLKDRSSIQAEILGSAEREGAELIDRAKRVVDRQALDAGREAEEILEAARQRANALLARERQNLLAQAVAEGRNLRLSKQNWYFEQIFSEVLQRLAAMPRDEAYLTVLKELAAEAAASLGVAEAVVRGNREDRDFLLEGDGLAKLTAHVQDACGSDLALTLAEEPIDATGGLVLESADGRTAYYNTFDDIATRQEDRFRSLIMTELAE